MSIQVQVLDANGTNLLKRGTVLCIPQDTPEGALDRAEQLAKEHVSQPERIGFIICSPFTDIEEHQHG